MIGIARQMIGLVCQMVGLETDDRIVFPNDRIGFPPFPPCKTVPVTMPGLGLKAKKKISARPCRGAARLWEVVRRLGLLSGYFSSDKARLLTKIGE